MYTALYREKNTIKRSLNTHIQFFLTYENKKNTSTGLMGCQYHELRGIESVAPVQANLLNVLCTTSHQLTPTKQTWPSGCWHYRKATAPPKHAFSYVAIPYKVCKATITLNIYISKTSRQNTPPFESVHDKVSQNVSLAACLCLSSVDVVPLWLCKSALL